jgi:1,2-dihydroxy-3-keto-5-methylthiopentene dioxygenase
MAIVRISDENVTLREPQAVQQRLAEIGIEYETWQPAYPIPESASADEVLDAYSSELEWLKLRGGFATADVIDINPQTAGLPEMLARFNREHWHDEDEVRFILAGRGVFHIHPPAGAVVAIEVEPGDLIRVPRGTRHWFDLCAERRIRAIRLFQDPSGWTPHYTKTGVDKRYQPVCFGPSHVTSLSFKYQTGPSVRLLDIEGTVTPVSFVYQTLFPYARRRLQTFLTAARDKELEIALQSLCKDRLEDWLSGDRPPEADSEYLLWLMDRDRKSTALKIIQGRIWQRGFENGELVTDVFPDVAPALERWTASGQRVAIFSSGSVLAQQLLFRHTPHGDLTRFLAAYFDTGTGAKRDPDSYRSIAAKLGCPASEIQFISDVTAELDAAAQAGMETVLAVRPGNHEQSAPLQVRLIQSFAEAF